MGEHWTEQPDVFNMIRLAVSRRLKQNPRLLKKNHDLDEESIVQDLWGECVKAKYDPAKTQPHTFAYKVAWTRFSDIVRARGIRVESDSRPQESDGRGRGDGRSVDFDDPEAEISEIARRIYVGILPYCEQAAKPRTGPGRPTPTFAQKSAIAMLMKQMRWSVRDAESMTKRYPSILAAVGVAQSKHYSFFSRVASGVAKFARKQKKLLAQKSTLPVPA